MNRNQQYMYMLRFNIVRCVFLLFYVLLKHIILQRRIQDFKVGMGGELKKIAPSGGRREHFWDISCEKSRFNAKKIKFLPILGGEGGRRVRPLDPPLFYMCEYSDALKLPKSYPTPALPRDGQGLEIK